MSENVARRVRLIGLVSGVAAIAGIGVLLLSDLGFGQSFFHLQQLSLLLAAAGLWVVHMPLDFGSRCWRRRATAGKITQALKGRKS